MSYGSCAANTSCSSSLELTDSHTTHHSHPDRTVCFHCSSLPGKYYQRSTWLHPHGRTKLEVGSGMQANHRPPQNWDPTAAKRFGEAAQGCSAATPDLQHRGRSCIHWSQKGCKRPRRLSSPTITHLCCCRGSRRCTEGTRNTDVSPKFQSGGNSGMQMASQFYQLSFLRCKITSYIPPRDGLGGLSFCLVVF